MSVGQMSVNQTCISNMSINKKFAGQIFWAICLVTHISVCQMSVGKNNCRLKVFRPSVFWPKDEKLTFNFFGSFEKVFFSSKKKIELSSFQPMVSNLEGG
jgi:hypothetical protein